jgi:MFS family permease
MDVDPAYARHNVRLYYAYLLLANFGLWYGVWIKYLVFPRGFELRYILLMDMPFWLLVATLEAPFGALGDRFGRKRMMALGQLAFALTILGFGFSTTYWLLFFDYVLWAFAQALMSGVDQALVYDSLKAGRLEKQFSRIAGRGFSISIVAGMISTLLGGFFAERTSLAFTIQISAVMPVAGAMIALAMREPPRQRSEHHYLHDLGQAFSFAWRHPQVRYSVALASVIMAAGFAPVVLVQPFLMEHNVSTGLFGVYQAPLRVVSVLAALFAFRSVRRAGTPVLLPLACAGMVLAFLGLGAVNSLGAFAFFALPSLVQGTIKPTMDGYINERTPSERRATVLSIASLTISLQLALFEPALGFITDLGSVARASLFAAGWFTLVMPPLLWLWLRAHRGIHDLRFAPHDALEPSAAAGEPAS